DSTGIRYGTSALDDYVTQAARTQNRVVRPDPEPEKGFYFRSDHFPLAKVGVPALDPDAGHNTVRPGAWAARWRICGSSSGWGTNWPTSPRSPTGSPARNSRPRATR